MQSEYLIVLMVFFFATLIRSALGFGQALVALPILALIMPVKTAVPICVLVSVLIAMVIVIQDGKKVDVDSAKWLILSAASVLPIGIYVLVTFDAKSVKLGLGLFIIVYVLYSILNKKSYRIPNNRLYLFGFGLVSGVLGGAYGLNGPPLIVYGNLRGWSAEKFRATLQAYFLPLEIMGMLGFWYEGLWTREVSQYFLISVPVVLPAIFLGRIVNKKFRKELFVGSVYATLVAIGLLMIYPFD